MTNKLNENGLNSKQQAFCDEYIKNKNNGMLAYKSVFKTNNEDSCRALSSKLLTNISVASFLREKQQKLSEKYGITQQTLLQELDDAKALAMLPDDRGKREMSVVVRIIEVKAKMLGLNEPQEIKLLGDKNNPIEIQVSEGFQKMVKEVLGFDDNYQK